MSFELRVQAAMEKFDQRGSDSKIARAVMDTLISRASDGKVAPEDRQHHVELLEAFVEELAKS